MQLIMEGNIYKIVFVQTAAALLHKAFRLTAQNSLSYVADTRELTAWTTEGLYAQTITIIIIFNRTKMYNHTNKQNRR
jgi:hypothetical protein